MANVTLTDDFGNKKEISFDELQEQSMNFEKSLSDFVTDQFFACECDKVVLMGNAVTLEDETVVCPDCAGK